MLGRLRHGTPRSRLDFLRTVPLFAGLPDKVLDGLDGHLDDLEVEAGATLTTQGQQGYETFVVVEGTAEVLADGQVVAELGPGELIGEIAVLQHRVRTATVRARTPMRLLVVESRQVDALLADPKLAPRVQAGLARHLAARADAHPAQE